MGTGPPLMPSYFRYDMSGFTRGEGGQRETTVYP